MEAVILFAKDIWEGEFPNIKSYLETEIEIGKGNWIKRANSYIQTLNLSWKKIKEMPRAEIKAQIREWDTETWKKEMMSLSTMKWYVEAKMRIRYDNCYTNKITSQFLAKARTNSLKVREVMGRTTENKKNKFDTTCKLCGKEEEDLEHFMIKCTKLEEGRNKKIMEKMKKIEEKNRL